VPTSQLSYLLTGLLGPDVSFEARAVPPACASFIEEKQWKRIQELETFECFAELPEEIERNPQEWAAFIQDDSPGGQPADAPSPFSCSELPAFA
jgi:hypothetical protein